METGYTIVVPDRDLLSRLCGTNDSNLNLIEKHLGVSVFTHGNELSLGKADVAVVRQLRHIVDRVLDEAKAGYEVTQDLLTSILQPETEWEDRTLKNPEIVIPGGVKKVYPKTKNQGTLINLLRNKDMVFCTGPAGSGKTYLMIAEALRLLLSHEKRAIVLTRPVVEAGESLGYLPGDLEQKINPYLRPLFDSINDLVPSNYVKKLLESGMIEAAPLAYMRGRTLQDSVIILDEAQNTTREQMKMFLTRMGEGSKVFITGDITQIDLPARIPSGLVHALEILNAIPEIGMVSMEAEDVVRNPLVKKIVQAYENNKNND